MKKYKLTDQNMRTNNGFQWVLGKEREATGAGVELCSDGYLHFYDSPELAVLLNPIGANFDNPRLFIAKVSGKKLDDNGLKCGYKKATLLKEIPLPTFTITQRIASGIYCALTVYKDKNFKRWAKNWLSGKDRSYAAAVVAVRADAGAGAARVDVGAAAIYAAARVVYAAVYAARAARVDVGAARAVYAAVYAARTARAAGKNPSKMLKLVVQKTLKFRG